MEESIIGVYEISRCLMYPSGARVGRDTSDFDAPGRELYHNEDVIRHEAFSCPNLDRCEVRSAQDVSVSFQKCFPSRLLAAIWREFDSVLAETVAHSCIRKVNAQVLERALNAVITPRWILLGHPHE